MLTSVVFAVTGVAIAVVGVFWFRAYVSLRNEIAAAARAARAENFAKLEHLAHLLAEVRAAVTSNGLVSRLRVMDEESLANELRDWALSAAGREEVDELLRALARAERTI